MSFGGLKPVRKLTGDNTFTTKRFRKSGTTTRPNDLIYVGDPVYLQAAGTVARLLTAEVTAAGNATGGVTVLGVVARVLTDVNGTPRVHGLPAQHPNISLSGDTGDFIDVYVDPNIVYVATIGVSADIATHLGVNCTVSAGARVTAAGISGTELVVGGSAIFSEGPFKIIAVADSVGVSSAAAQGLVEVIVNGGQYGTRGGVA